MAKIDVKHITLAIIFLILTSCNLQRNMLYYPSTDLPSQASLTSYNIQFWPSGSNGYRGFVSAVQTSKIKGTIIVFHGNAGTAADRAYYVEALTPLGYRVILAEYPGYGGRKGELREETFVRDAKETLRLASEQYKSPIFLLGESLGCGVAAAAAKDSPVKIDGVILITPWDTLLSVAKEHFPWLPVRLFLKDKYDTIANLKEFQGRIAIVGAERDDIVPVQHAQTLFKSLSGAPGFHKMFTIRGAGHNDWPDMVGPAWWKEIAEFIYQ
jgi:pimeloyl-ACP methyl ester carboxylesterase